MALAKAEIARYEEEGFNVYILDASVLLEAGWDNETNEVWMTIAPEVSKNLLRILKSKRKTELSPK